MLSGAEKRISNFLGQLPGLGIFKDYLRAKILATPLTLVLHLYKYSV